MTLVIEPDGVRRAGARALSLAATLVEEIDALSATPSELPDSKLLASDHLAIELDVVVSELRGDLRALLSFAAALGAAPSQLMALDQRLAHGVPLPRSDHGRVLRHLPIRLSDVAGTLIAETALGCIPPETLDVIDPLLALIPDGPGFARPVAQPQLVSATPRSPAGWLATVRQAQDRPGQISVTHLDNGRWVVSLPGIHSLTEGVDPMDLPGAARAFSTGHGAYARAVVMALVQAGVPAGAPLMLTGHSQGGIVAADLAADPMVASRWRITHVLTAAAPINDTRVAGSTSMLALRNSDDIVPSLDLRPAPSFRQLPAPVAAGPAGGAAGGATPVGATPVGATPVGATPVSATPVSATPVGATPVGATPVGATPISATPIAGQRTTITFGDEHGDIGLNHALATTYLPFAESARFANDPRAKAWEAGAAAYLEGGPATVQRFQLLDRAPAAAPLATPGRG